MSAAETLNAMLWGAILVLGVVMIVLVPKRPTTGIGKWLYTAIGRRLPRSFSWRQIVDRYERGEAAYFDPNDPPIGSTPPEEMAAVRAQMDKSMAAVNQLTEDLTSGKLAIVDGPSAAKLRGIERSAAERAIEKAAKRERARALDAEGLPRKAIAKELGVKERYVYELLEAPKTTD